MNAQEAAWDHFNQVVQESRNSRTPDEEDRAEIAVMLKSLFHAHPIVKNYIKGWATFHPNMTLQEFWNIARTL